MWVAACIKRTDVFRDVRLIQSNHHLCTPFSLILKPCIWHSQIEISCHFNGRVSPKENLPMIINCFKDWGKVDIQNWQIFETHRVPENLNFLSFWVGHNLSGYVDTIRCIKYIVTHMISQIGISDLFVGSKTHLYDMFDFFTSNLDSTFNTPGTLLMTSSTSIWQ